MDVRDGGAGCVSAQGSPDSRISKTFALSLLPRRPAKVSQIKGSRRKRLGGKPRKKGFYNGVTQPDHRCFTEWRRSTV